MDGVREASLFLFHFQLWNEVQLLIGLSSLKKLVVLSYD